jgi:WD repeat-containing protein 45
LIRVFATSNCARIAELRRGVDHATIFSLAISPSSQLLAVTSDKSTLHIFDIPHPINPIRTEASNTSKRLTSMGNGGNPSSADDSGSQKWGILGKIPLLPRVFSDIYSFASAHFEMGDETLPRLTASLDSGLAGYGRPYKGLIGWTSDHSLIVIGAGLDGRWEKFIIAEGEDGKRYCVRDGWKRYLGAS